MILLDLDDTLLDHTQAQRSAAALFGKQYADRIPDYAAETFPDDWARICTTHFAAFTRGEISFLEQRRRRLRDAFNEPHLSAEEADLIFAHQLKNYETSWTLFPDVMPFLERWRSSRFAVLTNGQRTQQEKKLNKTGINDYFEFLVTVEDVGVGKPNPKIFEKACELANLRPDQIIYIGDDLKKDALAAAEVGMRGLWLNRGNEMTQVNVPEIKSLADFNLRDIIVR